MDTKGTNMDTDKRDFVERATDVGMAFCIWALVAFIATATVLFVVLMLAKSGVN